MKKLILIPVLTLLFSLVYSVSAIAGYIAQDVVIVSVSNTNRNEDTFTVWIEGGETKCTTIDFPRSASPSTEIHKRAFSSALAAFTTGAKAVIYNYKGEDCRNASLIRLLK